MYLDYRDDWRYVLSAGRTGTVFLENLIKSHVSGVTAIHEPTATRYQMMLANLRNDIGIGHRVLKKIFDRSRLARKKKTEGIYVEINPFLCPLTDLLLDPIRELRVVHLVRDPGHWARSISAFKASRNFRLLIDWAPFAKPFPSPRPTNWHGMSEFEKSLWRWRWCNERILGLRDECSAFVVVRYEDLFSKNLSQRYVAITNIFDTLDIPKPNKFNWKDFATRINPAPANQIQIDWAITEKICGDLARNLGYAYKVV